MSETVRDSSAESYAQNEARQVFRTKKQRILDMLADRGPMTRKQLAWHLDLETATVSGLVTPMIRENKLEECEKEECPVTGRMVYPVRIPVLQRELF